MVTHAAWPTRTSAGTRVYGLRDLRAHLQMASLSFDVFSGDLVAGPLLGRGLVVAPQELLFSPERLHALIARDR